MLAQYRKKKIWWKKGKSNQFVLLSKRPKRQYEGRIVFILTIQFDLKNKEITLVRGLTSVQNKKEINVNRTCKSTEAYFLTASLTDFVTG